MLKRSHLFALAGVLSLATAPAFASPVLTIGNPSGPYYVNFNNLALGNAGGVANADVFVSFTGDALTTTGFSSGIYAAPYVNGNGVPFGDNTIGSDTTRYLSTGIGSVTLKFTLDQTYLGLLWGSVDLYNNLTLYKGNTQVAAFSGGDVNAAANGDQGVAGSQYVNISGLPAFDRAVFTSDGYAFEFDNVSYNVDPPAAVPEPMTLSLFAAGLAGAGAIRRRIKNKSR